MVKVIRVLGTLLFILFLLNCSTNIAGGATDTETGGIAKGIIIDSNGKGAPNTQVKLIPREYNPVVGNPITASAIDTTNAKGNYTFKIKYSGVFNIEATHLNDKTRSFIRDVTLGKDTTLVPQATLKSPGFVEVFLPDTIDTAKGYLYFEGTTLSRTLNAAIVQSGADFLLTFNDVPEANFPTIKYGKLNNPDVTIPLTDPVQVLSKDTTIVEVCFDWIHYTSKNSKLPGDTILDILVENDGTIWFAVKGHNFSRLINGVWRNYATTLPSNTVRKMLRDRNGTMWFATDDGIGSLNDSDWSEYDSAETGMPSNYVTGVDEDSKGNLWFSTRGGSLVKYDHSVWTVYDTADQSEFAQDIIDVEVDDNDMAWYIADSTLLSYDGTYWHSKSLDVPGIYSPRVFDLAIDAAYNKWIGFYKVLMQYDGNFLTLYNESHSPVLNDMVHAVEVDKDDNIWAGTGRGLTTFTGETWIDRTGHRYSLLDNKSIRSIAFDNTGFIWLGTAGDGVIAFGKGRR